MSTSARNRSLKSAELPVWAQKSFDEQGDQELWRLRKEGSAEDLTVYFAEKLLRLNLQPTRSVLKAVIQTIESDAEIVKGTLDSALRRIDLLGIFSATDAGNAARHVRKHLEMIRHCRQGQGWLIWDGSRWQADCLGKTTELAKGTARGIYNEAAEEVDETRRKDLVRWAKASEDVRRLRAMVDLAASDERVATALADLDNDPWLLNVANGTLNLRTRQLGGHNPHHLITRTTAAAYHPEARHPTWDGFLEQMVPDPEVRAFLARAAGYSLCGDTGEEVVFLVHGPGGSGKSTFGEAMRGVLGDYAATADFETFLQGKNSGVRNDIARLRGARLVLSLEVDDGRKLAIAVLKSLTGGDTIPARFLYGEHFEFKPAFKLWLVANHRPKADPSDGGLWRRILLIPFTNSLPDGKRDRNLKRTLREDPEIRAAILAWAVRGFSDWHKNGLQVPDSVRLATEEYREECDDLAGFFDECCVLGPAGRTKNSDLRGACNSWCAENGVTPPNPKSLAGALARKGCTKVKIARDRGWSGVALTAVQYR